MHILALIGSGRKHGNTSRIVDLARSAFESHAQERAVEVDWQTVYLPGLELKQCRGCRSCFNHGEDHCPNGDSLLEIRDAIANADGVVLASPVYVNDVSGSMKTLIDRLAFVCHRPQFMHTPFLLLATTGGTPARHALRTLQSAAVSWGAPIAATAAFDTGALSTNDEIAAHASRLVSPARRFFHCIEAQKAGRPPFISLVVFAIQQRSWKRYWQKHSVTRSEDVRYWQEAGWLEQNATYFFPHHSSRIRVAAARTVAAITAPFLS